MLLFGDEWESGTVVSGGERVARNLCTIAYEFSRRKLFLGQAPTNTAFATSPRRYLNRGDLITFPNGRVVLVRSVGTLAISVQAWFVLSGASGPRGIDSTLFADKYFRFDVVRCIYAFNVFGPNKVLAPSYR